MNLEEPYLDFQAKLQAAVVVPTKKAMSLPKDLQFYRTLDSHFSQDLDACNTRLLSVINNLLNYADKKGSIGKGKAKVQSLEDVLSSFTPMVVSRLDRMFENTVSLFAVSIKKRKLRPNIM
jgi:exosome complex exonuclease RRP6